MFVLQLSYEQNVVIRKLSPCDNWAFWVHHHLQEVAFKILIFGWYLACYLIIVLVIYYTCNYFHFQGVFLFLILQKNVHFYSCSLNWKKNSGKIDCLFKWLFSQEILVTWKTIFTVNLSFEITIFTINFYCLVFMKCIFFFFCIVSVPLHISLSQW